MNRHRKRRPESEFGHLPERRNFIGAKQKLNAAHAMGALALAGVLGGVTGSIGVFVLAAAAFLAAAWHAGEIRR